MTRYIATGLGLLVLLLFLLQLASPIRINFDSTIMLLLADTHAQGGGFLFRGEPTVIPPGYPWILSQLFRWHLASPFAILLVNYLSLAVGLVAMNGLLASHFSRWGRLLLLTGATLSFPLIKHITIVCNEFVFIGMLFPALWLLDQAWRNQSFRSLLAAWCLTFGVIAMRRPGLMFLAPLGLVTAWLWWRKRSWAFLMFPLLLAGMAWFVKANYTLADYTKPATDFVLVLQSRFSELGQIAINLPAGQLPFLPPALLLTTGGLFFGLVGLGLWRMRAEAGPAEVFFLAYTVMMFTWTYTDVRFWIPVTPLVVVYVWRSLEKFPRPLTLGICICWCLIGLAALVFSSRVTFSGDRFPEVYAGGNLRVAYCLALKTCAGDASRANPDDIAALQLVYPR